MAPRLVAAVALAVVCLSGCDLPSLGSHMEPSPTATAAASTDPQTAFNDAYRTALETALVTPPGKARAYQYKIVNGDGIVLSDWRTVYNPDGTISAVRTSAMNPDYSVVCLSDEECYTNVAGEPFWWKTDATVLGVPYMFDPQQPITPIMEGMTLTVDGGTFTAARGEGYSVQVVIVDDMVIRHERSGPENDRLMYGWRVTDPVPVTRPLTVRD